jgi:hypothetical protein
MWNLPLLILGRHLTVVTGQMSSAAMKIPSHLERSCIESLFAALLEGHFRNNNMNQHLEDIAMATFVVHTLFVVGHRQFPVWIRKTN